jgi:transposase
MSKGKPKYEDSFKKQLVDLYNNGKSSTDIIKEYHVSWSALHKWIKFFNNTGSFKAKDNRSELENDNKKLLKENQQLRMEVDILKQAALIMGRK